MAIVIPNITDYEPFWIQRDGDSSATNILSAYGIVLRDSGYPMNRKAKAPYKNDWKDADGDDEWNTVINYEAFTYTFEGAIFANGATSSAAHADLKAAVKTFENWLRHGEFSFWSGYNKFGFRKVRIEEFHDPGASGFRDFGTSTRLFFSFTVKVNDPTTDMTLSNGQIVTA